MYVRILVLFLVFYGLPGISFGLESDSLKKIKITGEWDTSATAFFYGEIHDVRDGQAFTFEMMRKLHAENGISRLVLEWGKSKAWMFNAFLAEGDSTIFDYYRNAPQVLSILPPWKEFYKEINFQIYGIDFERGYFAYAVAALFRKHPEAMDTRLYKYLVQAKAELNLTIGDISGKKVTVRCYKHAKRLFARQRDTYRSLLGDDFPVVAEIMENPARQDRFDRRDKAMAENLVKIKEPFFCVMGMAHTCLRRKSVVKRYLESPAHGKPLVIDMVCRNCFSSYYNGARTVSMFADVEGLNLEYMRAAFDSFYESTTYPVIEQHQFKGLPGGYNEVPTYYVLFKDQPEW